MLMRNQRIKNVQKSENFPALIYFEPCDTFKEYVLSKKDDSSIQNEYTILSDTVEQHGVNRRLSYMGIEWGRLPRDDGELGELLLQDPIGSHADGEERFIPSFLRDLQLKFLAYSALQDY